MTTIQKTDSEPLPPGWKWVRLGELCDSISTTDPRKEPDKKFTYIDISSIDRQTKSIVAPTVLSGKDAPTRARRIVRKGDVLVATTRPNLNAVALVGEELDGQVCSTGLCVLRPIPESTNPSWLYFATTHRDFVDSLSGAVAGAMYPAVSDKRVYEQTIPLPPLAEQQRIVAKLNEQMRAVERARKAAESRSEAAQALGQAHLRADFPAPEKATGTALQWVPLSSVSEIDYGYTASASDDAVGPKYLRITDIHKGRVNWNRVPNCVIDQKAEDKKRLYKGDIVVARTGSTGKSLLIRDVPRAVFASYLLRIRVLKDIDPVYLSYFFQTDTYWSHIWRHSRGAVQKNVNAKLLGNLPVPLVSELEQKNLVASIERKLVASNAAQLAAQAQLAEVEALPSALLRSAFSGAI